jgi:8-oxo-dGTP pyrophosphatase MutT (NUDIX family)
LCTRTTGTGPPGGSLDLNESPQHAAIREVFEKTGLVVDVEYFIAVYTLRTTRLGLRFLFRGAIRSGVLKPRTGEISELGWFHPDSLPSPMTRSGPTAIRDGLAGLRGIAREIGSEESPNFVA